MAPSYPLGSRKTDSGGRRVVLFIKLVAGPLPLAWPWISNMVSQGLPLWIQNEPHPSDMQVAALLRVAEWTL